MPNIQNLKNKILEKTHLVFILTDPDQEDNPIIYANEGFTALTGYSQEEVIGQNCRLLQGKDTDPETINKLNEAIKNRQPISVQILNYKKNGESFWNLLHIDPIYLEDEDKYYFVGIQKDITDVKLAEQQLAKYHREIELLSVPLVPVKEGVSVLPLIGDIDERRVETIVNNVLTEMEKDEIETLILDFSGFTNMDENATTGIFQLNDLLKLKGIHLIITGITPKIAMRTNRYNINFSRFTTFGSVKQAVEALEQ
ncbi:PAS domain-containing protein [Bacillus sp. A301a_S52]|nr:PAS domain-containing protein [Bacillus sp. A301a_S52]